MNFLIAVVVLSALKELHGLRWHDRRDRVFVHQLRVRIATQQQREIVEPGYNALKFDPIDQEDGDGSLVLPDVVQKHSRVLEKKGKEHPTHTHTHTQARGNLKKKKHEKAFDARRQ